jgi:hypothetical protein
LSILLNGYVPYERLAGWITGEVIYADGEASRMTPEVPTEISTLRLAIRMAQVFSRGDAITDELFQFFDFGKPAGFPSGPDWLISYTNGEYTSATGY